MQLLSSVRDLLRVRDDARLPRFDWWMQRNSTAESLLRTCERVRSHVEELAINPSLQVMRARCGSICDHKGLKPTQTRLPSHSLLHPSVMFEPRTTIAYQHAQ